jgi:hypothetical protein
MEMFQYEEVSQQSAIIFYVFLDKMFSNKWTEQHWEFFLFTTMSITVLWVLSG